MHFAKGPESSVLSRAIKRLEAGIGRFEIDEGTDRNMGKHDSRIWLVVRARSGRNGRLEKGVRRFGFTNSTECNRRGNLNPLVVTLQCFDERSCGQGLCDPLAIGGSAETKLLNRLILRRSHQCRNRFPSQQLTIGEDGSDTPLFLAARVIDDLKNGGRQSGIRTL